jgi:hypothetical protein
MAALHAQDIELVTQCRQKAQARLRELDAAISIALAITLFSSRIAGQSIALYLHKESPHSAGAVGLEIGEASFSHQAPASQGGERT